jgi:mono/diheme cytochrome c family protein
MDRTTAAALAAALCVFVALAAAGSPRESSAAAATPGAPPAPPERLADTGLYADTSLSTVAQDVLPYSPQYPLWTDGATKRRWIRLPAGASIDARDADAWDFPVGTKLWKEFAFDRRIETRYLERVSSRAWVYATYLWTADGRDARLAPERGVKGATESKPGVRYDVPARADCRICHEGRRTPVLGFTALQLSPDRDPLALHADAPRPGDVDLRVLAARGLLRGLPASTLARPPRIAAPTPRARAVLGYLETNCAICHTASGELASLGLLLDAPLESRAGPASALATALGRPSRFRFQDARHDADLRLVAGDPERSVLALRLGSRRPAAQMPPLGTRAVDAEAVALIEAWIREDLAVPPSDPRPSSHPEIVR